MDRFPSKTKKARAKAMRGYRKKHPESSNQLMWKWVLKQRGLTLAGYEDMIDMQEGLCAICGKPNANGKCLYLDHNHQTGQARGLLCARCNTGLTYVEDMLFRRACLRYLEDYHE